MLSIVASLLVASAILPTDTWADTVTVTTATDVLDGDVSSIADLITTPGADGVISLREAIEAANNTLGGDVIEFAIPGAGPHTIAPSPSLPPITEAVTIDGYTQSGAAPATITTNATIEITLDGISSAGFGLVMSGGNGTTIKGLEFYGHQIGIYILGPSSGNSVEGNFFGTDPTRASSIGASYGVVIEDSPGNTIGGATPASRNIIASAGFASLEAGVLIDGTLASGNTVQGNFIGADITGTITNPDGILNSDDEFGNFTGIFIDGAPDNLIGGTGPGEGNLISGNALGIAIGHPTATGNRVQGNLIGTDVTGTVTDPDGSPGTGDELGNLEAGVYIENAPDNIIGGAEPGAGNVIAGNGFSSEVLPIPGGVILTGSDATGNLVQGDFIGTDATGSLPLPNFSYGICMTQSASNNTIGAAGPGEGNIIAYNEVNGVFIESGTGNRILRNAIFNNGALGIDLEPAGVTANDAGDGDSGANNLQNFPVLTGATTDGSSSITITGTFNSTPNTNNFRLELFANSAADPSGHGEGETFIGADSVNTDGAGDASFSFTFNAAVAEGQFITATATSPDSSTSEYSQALAATAGLSIVNNLIQPKSKNVQWNASTNQFSFDLAIKNISGTNIGIPIRCVFTELNPGPPTITVANADGGGDGLGSYFDYSNQVGSNNLLTPDETSSYKTWIFNDPSAVNFTFFVDVYGSVSGGLPKAGALAKLKITVNTETGEVDFGDGKVEIDMLPSQFSLEQNYPNPFNPETRISYSLPEAAAVKLIVYNLKGQQIKSLVNEDKPAGSHEIIWNARDEFGRPVASGIYIYRIVAGEFSAVKKLTLVR